MIADEAQWRDWPAPAKLNLFLHITGRRDDGYHLLQTVFQFLDRCDNLSFVPRSDTAIRRFPAIEGLDEASDLVVRAADLLRKETGVVHGVDIHLEKRLPMGGGLGGGSSDAATTLCALNHLWQTGLSQSELAALGLKLGADVPVFVRGQAVWAEGVGEIFTPVELPEPWYLVVCPPCHVSTARVFGDAQLTRDCDQVKIDGFLSGQCGNVCEPVVFEAFPQVRQAFEWLERRFGNARMTGTGSCVFAECGDRADEAEAAIQTLPEGREAFVARGCNISSLKHRLAR